MAPLTHPELTVALALAAGILAQSVSRLLRLPGIVLLLASGALLGPEGVGWIEPRSLGDGLFGIVDFAVAIILFEGGLNLEWSRLKRQEAAMAVTTPFAKREAASKKAKGGAAAGGGRK